MDSFQMEHMETIPTYLLSLPTLPLPLLPNPTPESIFIFHFCSYLFTVADSVQMRINHCFVYVLMI